MVRPNKFVAYFAGIVLLGLGFAMVSVNILAEQRVRKIWPGTAESILSGLGKLRDVNVTREKPHSRDDVSFVMFSSWIDKPQKRVIHDNVLRTWPLTSPNIACLLFSEEEDEQRRVESFGWYGLPLPKTSCKGVPILREMAYTAMRMFPKAQLFAYANGDLLFGADLGVTVQHVLRQPMATTSPLLLLVHRDNLDFTGPYEVNLTDVEVVHDLKRRAVALRDGSSDIFMTNRLFPWRHTPDIVVGRIPIGLGLVSLGQVLNVTIVDLSRTVTSLHMTSTDGTKESSKHPDFMCNGNLFIRLKLTNKQFANCPYIGCASYISASKSMVGNSVRDVELVPVRDEFKEKQCSKCRFKISSLLKLNYTG